MVENARVSIADTTKQTNAFGSGILRVDQFLNPNIQIKAEKIWLAAYVPV
jgi:hypothetical protein